MANYNEEGNRPAPVKVDVECLSCGKVEQVECEYYWDVDDEQWTLLGPSWRHRCVKCETVYQERMARAREYQCANPPSWFDEGYAGERWDED